MIEELNRKELINEYETLQRGFFMPYAIAKKCALITVDKIIKSSTSLPILSDNGSFSSDIEENKIYWNEVKKEIEKL